MVSPYIRMHVESKKRYSSHALLFAAGDAKHAERPSGSQGQAATRWIWVFRDQREMLAL